MNIISTNPHFSVLFTAIGSHIGGSAQPEKVKEKVSRPMDAKAPNKGEAQPQYGEFHVKLNELVRRRQRLDALKIPVVPTVPDSPIIDAEPMDELARDVKSLERLVHSIDGTSWSSAEAMVNAQRNGGPELLRLPLSYNQYRTANSRFIELGHFSTAISDKERESARLDDEIADARVTLSEIRLKRAKAAIDAARKLAEASATPPAAATPTPTPSPQSQETIAQEPRSSVAGPARLPPATKPSVEIRPPRDLAPPPKSLRRSSPKDESHTQIGQLVTKSFRLSRGTPSGGQSSNWGTFSGTPRQSGQSDPKITTPQPAESETPPPAIQSAAPAEKAAAFGQFTGAAQKPQSDRPVGFGQFPAQTKPLQSNTPPSFGQHPASAQPPPRRAFGSEPPAKSPQEAPKPGEQIAAKSPLGEGKAITTGFNTSGGGFKIATPTAKPAGVGFGTPGAFGTKSKFSQKPEEIAAPAAKPQNAAKPVPLPPEASWNA
jgi:hypothetical protein